MDPFGPPRKKSRPDTFPNGNGPYQGFSELECKRFNTSEGCPFGNSCRYKHTPLDGYASEKESFGTVLGSKSKACLKFFSTSGCPYGEGCHFAHYMPEGISGLGITQGSNISSSGGFSRKGPSVPSSSLLPSLEQSSVPGGYKTRLCNKFDTAEGCRFGNNCHFAHGEKELKKSNGSVHPFDRDLDKFASSLVRTGGGPLEGRLGGLRGYREPTPPGLAAAASFGLSSTAKISIDASLAGAIIGKGGVNAKQICRLTGAKLSIRDHESDPNLKNIEMEGSFDQIKQASAMVRELLVHTDTVPAKPGGLGSHSYKTKLCENYAKGSCTFAERCHFAHGPTELRDSGARN